MCQCIFLSNDIQNISYPDKSALLPPRIGTHFLFQDIKVGNKEMYLEGHPATYYAVTFNQSLNHFNIVLSFMISNKFFNYFKKMIHASFSFAFRSLSVNTLGFLIFCPTKTPVFTFASKSIGYRRTQICH